MTENAIPVQWMAPVPASSSPSPSPSPAAGAGGAGVAGAASGPCRLVADSGVAVIGIRGDAEREHARLAIRSAILEALGQLTGLAPARIVLHAEPGEAPWALLDAPAGQRRAWLAISHDGDVSVAAISLQGAVGIDVTRIADAEAFPDWEPVARDFLGPEVTETLVRTPAANRMDAFARAWSEREARLKYMGRELVEWSPTGDSLLTACRCLPLSLPGGYAGVLTLPPD